jgi:hypothetical protein
MCLGNFSSNYNRSSRPVDTAAAAAAAVVVVVVVVTVWYHARRPMHYDHFCCIVHSHVTREPYRLKSYLCKCLLYYFQ